MYIGLFCSSRGEKAFTFSPSYGKKERKKEEERKKREEERKNEGRREKKEKREDDKRKIRIKVFVFFSWVNMRAHTLY